MNKQPCYNRYTHIIFKFIIIIIKNTTCNTINSYYSSTVIWNYDQKHL